jgi:hypothetical protein
METEASPLSDFLGIFPFASLPPAGTNSSKMAYCPDVGTGALMISNGSTWLTISTKRIVTYDSTTDGSGNYSVTFNPAFASTPHVNPVCYPAADSVTRVRVTAASNTGFTVKTERNPSIDVLGIAVLQVGTANVPNTPVRVVVIES